MESEEFKLGFQAGLASANKEVNELKAALEKSKTDMEKGFQQAFDMILVFRQKIDELLAQQTAKAGG